MTQMQPLVISVVSHGHGEMVAQLLHDIGRYVHVPVQVMLTQNVPEADPPQALPFPLHIIRNPRPRGFGANHNAAFRTSRPGYFCVLNPDVRIRADPFPALLAELAEERVGAVAPAIFKPDDGAEPNARRFPTAGSLLRKAVFGAPPMEYGAGDRPYPVDWISGVFMMFSGQTYAAAQGFNERYYMYYEDVDLCARLRGMGYAVRLVPGARAVHAARYDSHRQLRYLRWHLVSMARYLLTRY
jgi:hypothetical protein